MKHIIRRNQENDPLLAATRDWLTPARWRALLNWEPFLGGERISDYTPEFDIKEKPDSFVLKADLPGVHSEDLDVQANEHRITISGKREEEKEEKGESSYRLERSYGSFSRAFTLPETIDAGRVNAELKNGVLTLTVPKKAGHPSTSVKVNAS